MAEVNRGEIWQFSFPTPNRKRPVFVLTRQEIIGHLHSVTVAPITTTIRGIPSEVVIGPESGLKTTSAINLDNLATIPKRDSERLWAPCRRRSSQMCEKRCSSL